MLLRLEETARSASWSKDGEGGHKEKGTRSTGECCMRTCVISERASDGSAARINRTGGQAGGKPQVRRDLQQRGRLEGGWVWFEDVVVASRTGGTRKGWLTGDGSAQGPRSKKSSRTTDQGLGRLRAS